MFTQKAYDEITRHPLLICHNHYYNSHTNKNYYKHTSN
jgi:hypothetical protein